MDEDRIFGNLLDDDQRLLRHQADLSGVKHLNRLSPLRPEPGRAFNVMVTTGGPQAFDRVCGWYRVDGTGGSAATDAQPFELLPAGTGWDTLAWDYVQQWTGSLPPQQAGAMLRYRLAAHQAGQGPEAWVFADNQATSAGAATEFAVWVEGQGTPDWARAAVVYHIFIDRFNPGQGRDWLRPDSLSGFFGGTLRGVIEQLDYVRDLGFNTLWLSPLFASPSHHGYDATDYYQVEPRLGTNADLQELIDGAHAREMRVLLDFVPNHWSHLHATFQSARTDPNSPYRDWYTWTRWPDEYETYFGVRELPQINLRPGPARDYLLECARHWLGQGVDGFRLDYAYGPAHDFWADFQRACRTTRPDCWLFGEIIHTAPMQLSYAGRLDGTLDFLLARGLRETFGRGAWSLERFEAALSGHEAYFPRFFSRPAFLDNHDMNRILYIADGQHARVKLGALALFTLAGPPIVYYGTEAGVTQERPIHQNDFGIFEEARLPMKWHLDEPERELQEYIRRLAHLRARHPVLHHGSRRLVHLDETAYAYVREAGAQRVLAAFNLADQPRRLRLAATGLAPTAEDQLSGCAVRASDGLVELHLPAETGAFVA
jgi:cyclomaltodextrinase / maltogenic alpha-amylase / neopullulanase